jgi:hypothetical protein
MVSTRNHRIVQRIRRQAAESGCSSGENSPRLTLETVHSLNKKADVGERPKLGGSIAARNSPLEAFILGQ